ncbi:MAG: MBL fold metallo-hydrolase [Deltaproteobacteria bacterium]
MRRWLAVFLVLAVLALGIVGCGESQRIQKNDFDQNTTNQAEPAISNEPTDDPGSLQVHFIDVGQGDAILVVAPGGQAMLVDGGDGEYGQTVVDYLNSQGIKRLAVLVATHPHADHTGGLPAVLDRFPVDRVYMPRVTNNTDQFAGFLTAIKRQGLKINTARAGIKIPFPGAEAVFLAPNSQGYENLNDYGAVIKISYIKTSFLLTGDASEVSEGEMLASGMALKCNVLKVGHHGSSSATIPEFVQAVSPQYAVIMCGAGNDYGHPHRETLEAISQVGAKVYRTDLAGNIVMESDGDEIEVTTFKYEPEKARIVTEVPGHVVAGGPAHFYIGNRNSHKFHRPDCTSLPKEANRIIFNSREMAIKVGYEPCGRCLP